MVPKIINRGRFLIVIAATITTFVTLLITIQKRSKPLIEHDANSPFSRYGLLWDEMQQLNAQQKEMVHNIFIGDIKKDTVEIVIANYKEDLSWARMYTNITTAYVKDTETISSLARMMPSMTVISLPNIGRETHSYLYHIFNRYDSLANVTVFTQGGAPTQGYQGHRIGGGHMYCNSTLHDYVTAPDGHFIFTEVMRLDDAVHAVRKGYMNSKQCTYREHGRRISRCYDPSDFDVRMIPRIDHPFTVKLIGNLCRQENSTTCSPKLFWDKFIKLPYPPRNFIWYAQGAVFSLTKEQIRKRPRSEYEALLKEASKGQDTSSGFFMEYFWYYLVTSATHACRVSGAGADSFAAFGGDDPLSRLPVDQLSAMIP